jgi:hypothetical protein
VDIQVERELAEVLAELDRRDRQQGFLSGLFPKQRAFFDDTAKVKAAVAGRRGGKTWVDACGLYEAAKRNKRSLNPYICLSGVSARRIMWPVLCEFNDRYSLGLKLREHELVAELPENGSQIFLVGGDDPRKVEALRGPKYGRVVIDEAGSFPRQLLRYLQEDVLDAALMDLDGDLWFTGSPNAACAGHFHDITTGNNPKVAGVPTYTWNVLDNPFIPHAEDWLARKRAEKKWEEDNPVYRREYLGHWVKDGSSLVFRFDRARNWKADGPKPTWSVLGVDLGISEDEKTTAFVVVGWTRHDKTTRAYYAKKTARLWPEKAGDEVAKLCEQFPINQVVVDTGGLGKSYCDLWRKRSDIGRLVKPAEKKEKYTYVEFLNGELDAGRAEILHGARDLADELDLLQWDEDRKEYDPRFADHCSDAWLYAWRDCWAYSEKALPGEKTLEQLEDERIKRIEREMKQKNQSPASLRGRRL